MITNNSFVVTFIMCAFAYFISDFFFSDTVLYVVGGLIGTIAKGIGLESWFLSFWALILGLIIFLLFKTKNKNSVVGLFIIVYILLHVINMYLYAIMPDIQTVNHKYIHTAFSILVKSLLLSFVFYGKNVKI